ncbi:MAG: CAP domain-containing protein [Candidatus Campbellbacteria bacterium]|nr:CAP domain-containing protein [Candidatus Campbellbacteria bacterium]
MNYHPILGKVARERAEDMAENGYYGGEDYGLPYPPHVDHDGFGPNYYICKAGYIIDPWICEEAEEDPFINTVESIGWGSGSSRSSPQDQLNGWLNSPGHRRHVLATSGPHEVASTNYGIGHAATGDSPDRPGRSASFWVFIAAPPPESSE